MINDHQYHLLKNLPVLVVVVLLSVFISVKYRYDIENKIQEIQELTIKPAVYELISRNNFTVNDAKGNNSEINIKNDDFDWKQYVDNYEDLSKNDENIN